MSFLERLSVLLRSKKTSWVGILSMILGVLVALGIVDLEAKDMIETSANTVLDESANLTDSLVGLIIAVQGLGFLFAKDGDKSTEDVNKKK